MIGIDASEFWTESCSRTTTYNNANNQIVAFEQENEWTNREQIKEDATSEEEERVEISEVKSEIDAMHKHDTPHLTHIHAACVPQSSLRASYSSRSSSPWSIRKRAHS